MDKSNLYPVMINKAKKTGNSDFFKGKEPAYGIVNAVLMRNLCVNLDKAGIPYMLYSIKSNKKDIILVDKKDLSKVIDIEKGTRIRLGLEIETKDELHMSVFECNKRGSKKDKIFSLNNLTDYEASRINNLAQQMNITVIMQQTGFNSFEIQAHEKRKRQILKLLLMAMYEENFEPDKTEKRMEFFKNDRTIKEFIEDPSKISGEYIIASASEKDFVKVSCDEFRYYDQTGAKLAREFNKVPDTFKDTLSLAVGCMEKPLVVLTSSEYEFTYSKNLSECIAAKYPKQELTTSEKTEKIANGLITMVGTTNDSILFNDSPITALENKGLDSNIAEQFAEILSDRFDNISAESITPQVNINYIIKEETGYDVEDITKTIMGQYITSDLGKEENSVDSMLIDDKPEQSKAFNEPVQHRNRDVEVE